MVAILKLSLPPVFTKFFSSCLSKQKINLVKIALCSLSIEELHSHKHTHTKIKTTTTKKDQQLSESNRNQSTFTIWGPKLDFYKMIIDIKHIGKKEEEFHFHTFHL